MKAIPPYDVAVIGAGVIGSAIARDLAGTSASVALLDVREDVCEGTSKANTAILHTGFDATPGTLEAELVREGYHLTQEYCEATGVALKRCGAVLVAWDEEEQATLPSLQEKAEKNGYTKTEIIDAGSVYGLLPHLGAGVRGGLTVPDESIIDAWSLPLAFATEAVTRGATLLLDHEVTHVAVGEETTVLGTNHGDVEARWVINAAGLGGDILDQRFGYDRIRIHPRKGELFVYDKLSAELVDRIVLAVPSKKGKGVLVSPTAFGNVMLGPTADDGEDRLDTSTTESGFEFLLEKGAHIFPQLLDEEVTSSYAGLRAAHNLSDYLIEVDEGQRYLIAAGIRSTGLTSAMAVSRHVMGMLADHMNLTERDDLPEPPTMPPLGEHQMRPFADRELLESDPAYGEIVCFCERVTRGEIRDAMNSTIPPTTINGLRRRTRAMNGRCQGFFCGAEVSAQFNASAKGN
ncbi:FAD/NAD(P)-binding oxidoreductase [Flaviflexus salsibiostraticola]|uniref:FAD/NAD(P)-binding oxidoreductase n=1 Tax=Flaviflexus salsibiostraticola TaxID=1282737 RepID=A0A3Q8WVA6_9ACTO|nr:NAD(P)/FAD-dependent oxidoreductase [Flaviflexus salsibiostraticola]AZN30937.1 FAD/NAD(P)-binding oxidoreductase [Flaviflexus salsibiostraticola]